MATEAQKRAMAKWNKANTTLITLRFNKEKDKDVLKRLDEKGKTAYIRDLIRKDIQSEKAEILADEIEGINLKQAEMIVKLYDEIYGDELVDIVKDYENGYLTINEGRDGNEYAWYGDELKNKAVNLATGEVIDGEKIDERIY